MFALMGPQACDEMYALMRVPMHVLISVQIKIDHTFPPQIACTAEIKYCCQQTINCDERSVPSESRLVSPMSQARRFRSGTA